MNSKHKNRALSGVAGGALLAGAMVAMSGGAAVAAPSAAQLTCDVPAFGSSMDYPAQAEVKAVRAAAGQVKIELSLSDMPGIVPLPLTNVPISGKATTTVDGAAVTLAGTHTVASIGTKAPIPAPKMSATVTSSASSVAVNVSKVDFVATAMGMDVAVSCAAVSGLTQTIAVTETAPAPAKTAATVKVTPKVSKKKVATVKVAVSGAQGKAAGKVKVTVKKGKKTVKKATVTLKNGAASVKTKKLAKGKYTVITSYAGSTSYKAATKKVSFRVR